MFNASINIHEWNERDTVWNYLLLADENMFREIQCLN